jgi:hypothetical protein
MLGTVAMAISGARALIAGLPLGEAVVALGKNLHVHLLQFKENNENAVLLARRIAGLTETVELAVKHIGADGLPVSLAAVMETLVQATGLITALQNHVVYRKFVKTGKIAKEFAAIEGSLISNIAELNALLGAKGLEQTAKYCDKILDKLESEQTNIEQVRQAQAAQTDAFDRLLAQLSASAAASTGSNGAAQTQQLVNEMAVTLECDVADVKKALEDVCGAIDQKLSMVLDSLSEQISGLGVKVDQNGMKLDTVNEKLDQLGREKEKQNRRAINREGTSDNFTQLSVDPSEFKIDREMVLGTGGFAKVYGGTS